MTQQTNNPDNEPFTFNDYCNEPAFPLPKGCESEGLNKFEYFVSVLMAVPTHSGMLRSVDNAVTVARDYLEALFAMQNTSD